MLRVPALAISPRLFTSVFLSATLLIGGVALADQKKGDACAASLPKNARMIYDASSKDAAAAPDLRGLVESKTRSLVMSGNLARGEARDAAEAAGKCLLALRS